MTKLLGKVAIVVGGYGGIGLACAEAFASEGARCVLLGRKETALRQSVTELSGSGHIYEVLEVTDSAGFDRIRDRTASGLGRADILVNAAGFTQPVRHAELDALDDTLIDAMFAVNWRGSYAAIRAFAPMLAAHDDGFIANISSIAAVTGTGSNVAYCAVKAAIDSLTVTMARALAPAVRVVSIAPGVVETNFVPGRDADWRREQAERTPLKRSVTSQDVAAATMACLLHLPATTGSVLQVDAGRHL